MQQSDDPREEIHEASLEQVVDVEQVVEQFLSAEIDAAAVRRGNDKMHQKTLAPS